MSEPEHPDEYARFLALVTSSREARREADEIKDLESMKAFLLRRGFRIEHLDVQAAYAALEQILVFYEV